MYICMLCIAFKQPEKDTATFHMLNTKLAIFINIIYKYKNLCEQMLLAVRLKKRVVSIVNVMACFGSLTAH